MARLIVATKNKGKMKEIKALLDALPYDVLSMEDAGVDVDVEETGITFEENALLKADAVYQAVKSQMVPLTHAHHVPVQADVSEMHLEETECQVIASSRGTHAEETECQVIASSRDTHAEDADFLVLADDSGLEVDALHGEPGIYSARYGGPGLDDTGRWQLLLDNMRNIPQGERRARFVCAAALVSGSHRQVVRGTVEGSILFAPRGDNGFGYDPVFLVDDLGKSTAELDDAEKNRISHRGRALEEIRRLLTEAKPI